MGKTFQDPARRCKRCGTALTSETTGGLCPRCLMEMSLASRTMPGGEPSPQVPPPSPEEMAARFPQFEILECLGRGGMGIVYKARQKSLDRLVAIKVLADGRHDEAEFAARFSREARTLAKMSHPNIVTVFDHGESDGLFYIVMEYVDGVNLRDLLCEGKIEPAQALAIVPPICEALEYAHDKGVVHRDIKPENILMDRDGRVKIADFGIASLIGADADHSGTPPYMAPEQQAAGGTIDHRADIYALGVVFYEMLTGERPEQDPSKPSGRVEIDVRLDEIVLRALEKEPARRYQTAGEFRTVVETMGAHASPGTTAAPGKRPGGIRPSGKRRFFAPLMVVRDGERVVYWPGVIQDSLLLAGIYSICWLITMMVLSPFFGTPHPGALLGGIIGFLIGMLAFGFYRSVKTPTDLLRQVGCQDPNRESAGNHPEPPDPGRASRRRAWETTSLFAGTLFFVGLSSFAWEWSGPMKNALLVICGLGLGICFLSLVGLWPFSSPLFPQPNFSSRNLHSRRAHLMFGGFLVLIAAGTASVFWLQRPVMIDDRGISADSPDGMFSASGQTWHEMRILDGDRTFYRFTVQGRAGAVFEKWDVDVPYDKLATSYILLSRDEVLFGRHGEIVWSDDGKRASFQVKGVEVAGFNTESGKPIIPRPGIRRAASQAYTFGPVIERTMSDLDPETSKSMIDLDSETAGTAKAADTPELVARAFMEAFRDGDIGAAMKWISPEMKAGVGIQKVLAGLSEQLRNKLYAGILDRLTKFTEWYPEHPDANTRFVGARIAGIPADDGSEREHGLYLILSPTPEGWKVAHLDDAYSDKPLSHYVDRIVRILPGEGPEFREQAEEQSLDAVESAAGKATESRSK